MTEENLIAIFYRIKNLTLLNWRSVIDTTEPVTLRYSEDIGTIIKSF